MTNLSERLFALKRVLKLQSKSQLAEVLGVSRTMLYHYEKDNPGPPSTFLQTLTDLEEKAGIELPLRTYVHEQPRTGVQHPVNEPRYNRRIKVVSMAHAGQAVSYDEMPEDWQEEIVTDCTDPKAFALKLVGNSMETKAGGLSFTDGDLIVAMPSKTPYSGCFVVCRFNDGGGILFRQFETVGKTIRLAPLNDNYKVTEHTGDDFTWMYPIHGRWTPLWKGQ